MIKTVRVQIFVPCKGVNINVYLDLLRKHIPHVPYQDNNDASFDMAILHSFKQ